MIREAIEKLEELYGEASGFRVLNLDERRMLVARGDEIREIEQSPPLRSPGLSSVSSLVAMAERCERPAVYFSHTRAELVLDREDRRELAVLDFETTQRWAAVWGLRNGLSFTPRDAVKFLRFDLHSVAPALLAGLRKVDFKRASEGRSQVEHGRESLGRSVEAAVQNIEAIPEEVEVEVPMFLTDGLDDLVQRVWIGVYIDLDAERIELRTLSDEIPSACRRVSRQIESILRTELPEGTPLYSGDFDREE